jgi:hypothetical protein
MKRLTLVPTDHVGLAAQRDLEAVQRLWASPVLMSIFDIPFTPLFIAAIFVFHPLLGWLAVAGGVFLIAITVLNQRMTLAPINRTNGLTLQAERMSDLIKTEAEAVQAAKTLVGMYPAREVHSQEIYGQAMKTVFMAAEWDFVRRVVDPINGLPSKLRYLPTVAEVNQALAAEQLRRHTIHLTAQWMLKEHDRRKAEAEERQRWAHLTPEDMERRRAQVAALLGGSDGKA